MNEQLDVLIVCLTNDISAEVTVKGLELGAHVFCEKPPGQSLADIHRIIQVEKHQPNQCLMYGFNHRYHDSVMDALMVIRSGELGEIINLRGVYGKSKMVSFNQSDWRTRRAIAGGGILLDQGIHMVDLMRLFAGEFTQVQSLISNSHWNFDVEDNAYALMQTNTGIVGMLHSSSTQWRHRFHLDINLEFGAITLSGLLTGTKSYGAETLSITRVNHETDAGDPVENITKYNQDASWEREIDYFTSCILQGESISNSSSIDAFKTMKLVTKIYYEDPVWRSKFNIENPDAYTL